MEGNVFIALYLVLSYRLPRFFKRNVMFRISESIERMWFLVPSVPEATRVLAMCTHNADKSVATTRYAAYDLLKSVSALFDSSGTRQAKLEYTPYGETLTAEGAWISAMPFRYSSEYRDEDLGLIYYNYRHYSPRGIQRSHWRIGILRRMNLFMALGSIIQGRE